MAIATAVEVTIGVDEWRKCDSVPAQAFPCDVTDPDTLNSGGGSGEILADEGGGQSHGFEDLR